MPNEEMITSWTSLLCHFYIPHSSMILNPVFSVLMIWVCNDGSSYFNKLLNQEIILTRIFHSDTQTRIDVGTTLIKLAVFLILQRFCIKSTVDK